MTAASIMVPIIAGQRCVGFLLNTARGVEAYDREERPLGVIPDAVEAATAVEISAASACQGCGGE
jgi:hypothetical protein